MSAAETRLLAALTRRLGERLVVVSDAPERWRGAAFEVREPQALTEDETTSNVVVACDLKRRTDAERAELMAACWMLVPTGAALVLVSPNPDALPEGPRDRTLDPRAGKRLLRVFGRVKKWRDQPFRWLVFSVTKRADGATDLDHEELQRLEMTADLCRGRVIELGCGRGDLAGLLRERGHDVVGVERSARKAEEAARRFPDVTILTADILDVPLPAAAFDTVLLPEVLEHVDAETGRLMLDAAWRLVAPGGRLVVTVPNEDLIPHPNHVREFDRASFEDVLRPYGAPVLCLDQPYKWLMASVDRA